MERKLSRRQFLAKATAAAAGLGILGLGVQCRATPTPHVVEKAATGTPVVKEIAPPEVTEAPETEVPLTAVGEKKLVRIILSSCGITQQGTLMKYLILNSEKQAAVFGDSHPDIDVKLEGTSACWGADGWVAKVVNQIQENRLEWCGTMPMFPFINIVSRAKSGMHVPMEEYITASKEPGADTLLEDMLPFVLEDANYQGHIYGIPYAFDVMTFNYRKDLCEPAGWRKPPETWEELYAACADFKKKHAAEEILPCAWVTPLEYSLHPYILSATEKPYTEDGLLDFMGAGVDCLEFMRRLLEAGFTPPHGREGWANMFGLRSGGLGAVLYIHGCTLYFWLHTDIGLPHALLPQTKVKGGGAGTLFYTNCASLFQNAPYPQELVDFLIWTYGPANHTMQMTVVTGLAESPVYQSIYDEMLAKDPTYSEYMWKDIVDMAAGSLMPPRNEYWLAQARAYERWAPQYFEKGSELTAEETAKNILDEVKAEIAKME